jgi:hypothetical protein
LLPYFRHLFTSIFSERNSELSYPKLPGAITILPHPNTCDPHMR